MPANGKVWFITGASSNFGIALARSLLEAGYRVAATARTVSKIALEPHESLLILTLDVSDAASISHAFDETLKTFGRIDVVVIKAGIHACGELESIPGEAAREMFDIQFWGPVRILAKATNIFEAQKHEGLIMNISSALAVFNAPLRSMISATKAATESLTNDRARTSPFVKVVNIRPGAFEKEPKTDFYPQIPAYASKDLGRTIAGSMRKQGSPPPGIGDVNMMAASLTALASAPNEQRPGAVSLGSDAYAMSRVCAQKRVDHLKAGQLLLRGISKSAGSRARGTQVWFVTNANSSFGQTAIRVLLGLGQRVAAVTAVTQPSPFTTDDALLVPEQQATMGPLAIGSALEATVGRFGRVDVVVNAPSAGLPSGGNEAEWEATHGLLERVFWESTGACSAAVAAFREHNPPGIGGRILNILTTPDSDAEVSNYHSAANVAVNAATTSLVRELPGKWNITAAAITVDPDLLANDETARVLLGLANLPARALPSQLPIGARALASAQRVARIGLSEALSRDAMSRAMETDYKHIDGRARIGLTEAIFTLILSPSPSYLSWVSSVLAALGWGLRLLAYEKILSRVLSGPAAPVTRKH